MNSNNINIYSSKNFYFFFIFKSKLNINEKIESCAYR